jgi:hypothetical protein
VTYSPVIQVDARSDQAAVRQIAAQTTAQGNAQLLELLRAHGVIRK